MKKTKVIIPALAMIGLSAVASVTGTVAWFTAQRTGSITTNDFVVTKTDGTLNVLSVAGVGTETNGDHGISAKDGAKIADASFNPATKELFIDAGTNESGVATNFTKVDDGSNYNVTSETSHPYVIAANTVYHAFTWQVKVSYTWEADHRDMNIFFDYNGSSMTGAENGSGDSNIGTRQGFRIAIINSDASHTVVYGKLQTAANLSGTCLVNAKAAYGTADTNLSNTNYAYFASDKYAFGNKAAASATTITAGSIAHAQDTDSSETQRAREDYLDNLTFSAAATVGNEKITTKTFTCVAWYEGNDPSVTGNDLEKVQSTIAFYSCINK